MATQRQAEGTLLGGRYEVLEIVGRGGMGTVYRAMDTRLDIPVAVKEMIEREPGSEEAVAAVRQFEREARLLAQLAHPNLPRVTDYFIDEDRWYLVMEYVEGTTLESVMQRAGSRALPLADALGYGIQIADVLAYLHGQTPPIVFRDVKPANIMVQSDSLIKLIDFGIARRFQAGATKDTLLYGSPGYSPPEQYGRTQTSPRSDIYALGATLHHLVTGRDPAATPFKFPPIRTLDPALPSALDAFIAQCVEMDEDRRCRSAEEARDTLIHIRAALPAPASPDAAHAARVPRDHAVTGPRVVSSRLRAAEQARRTRLFALALACLALVVLAGAVAFRMRPARVSDRGVKVAPAPAPPPDTAGPETAALPGVLKIASTPPGATIYLDGQQLGPSPQLVGRVSAGKHTIKLTPPADSGLVEATREIELQPGETREVSVPLTAPSAHPNSASGPTATIQSVQAAWETTAALARTGLQVSGACRVTGAAGKSGVMAVFFYDANQSPIKPDRPDSAFQNPDGLLSLSRSFQVEADPQDVGFALFMPADAFPQALDIRNPQTQVFYKVIVYVDGKSIGESDVRPVMSPGS